MVILNIIWMLNLVIGKYTDEKNILKIFCYSLIINKRDVMSEIKEFN